VVSVPRLFPDRTIVCIATGPSLTREDVEACRDKAPVIAVNDAVRYAPWADVLYACDAKWWSEHPETMTFTGRKYGLRAASGRPDVTVLKQGTDGGLSLDPTTLCTGKNSGYQAINLAVLLGAVRILLLGYDMQAAGTQVHFFGNHPWPSGPTPFGLFLAHFQTLVAPLRAAGVTVVNCTRSTRLTCFPRQPLAEALS
jgi:hypothetical protein